MINLSEVVERSKETGKHGEAEKEARSQDEAADKVPRIRQYEVLTILAARFGF